MNLSMNLSMNLNKQRGQSMLEAAVTLGAATIILLLAIQFIWVFYASQFVQYAALETVRVASKTSMDNLTMQANFNYLMNKDPQWRFSYVTMTRLRPTNKELEAYPSNDLDYKHELLVDYAEIRMAGMKPEQQEQYLKDRILLVEVTACYPLKVIIANRILNAAYSSYSKNAACLAQDHLGAVTWPIRRQIRVPLHSPLRVKK
ncbi:TadE family protein [Aliidiomarina haloalkalitolerans]|uniref:TadE-like domain-containing protein n=1 Tax=Aliidiomarina haloalkalitolerans TaxID=859059 RepID=A0A432VQS4_9GAMM|nr:TadE family protein [Aliidiomarina haloalkalitolerans]RUO18616.1 hypothetical protein CWE06_10255 [Aliidiomarina haloalkalitolerans]